MEDKKEEIRNEGRKRKKDFFLNPAKPISVPFAQKWHSWEGLKTQ